MALEVEVKDDVVDIRLSGTDAVWSLRRGLQLPVEEIVEARVVPREDALARVGWRLGGTYWPGRVAAGHFTVKGQPGDRAFCCVYRDAELLLVETRRRSPRLVVLQHPQRHDLAWYIGERIP